jgi:hypothetical protein
MLYVVPAVMLTWYRNERLGGVGCLAAAEETPQRATHARQRENSCILNCSGDEREQNISAAIAVLKS